MVCFLIQNISSRYFQFRGPNGESPIPFLPCETRKTQFPMNPSGGFTFHLSHQIGQPMGRL